MSVRKFFISFIFFTIILSIIAGTILYFAFIREPMIGQGEEEQLDGRINALILGTAPSGLNSDSMMLASLDRKAKTLDIMSIPRDTRVKIDGTYYKINAAHLMGGEKLSVQTVEELLGIPIDYYVSFNTTVFRKIIDELGGVYFNVPEQMDYEDPVQDLYIHLKPGQQLLDGDKAEQLVRYRQYVEGDLQRTAVQRDFVMALIDQKMKLSYINKIDDIYKVIQEDVKTNVDLSVIMKNLTVVKGMNTENVRTHMMPNTPENIGGVSYVLVETDDLNQMLVDYFGATIPGYTPTPSESVSPSPVEE